MYSFIHLLIHSVSGPNAIGSASSVSTLSALSTIALSLTARTSLWQNTARAADFRRNVLPREETEKSDSDRSMKTHSYKPEDLREPSTGIKRKRKKKRVCGSLANSKKIEGWWDWIWCYQSSFKEKKKEKKNLRKMSHASFVCTTYLSFLRFLFDPVGLSVPITVRRVCRNCFRCMSCTMFCKRMQVSET